MIILRYYTWLITYTFCVMFKIPFKYVVKDVFFLPSHVFDGLMLSNEDRKRLILKGMETIKLYWSTDETVIPPAFVVKKLLLIEAEARN